MLIEGKYMQKAGWSDYVNKLEDPRYPLVVDTNIYCTHINPDGMQFPPIEALADYLKPEQVEYEAVVEPEPPALGISVGEQAMVTDRIGK